MNKVKINENKNTPIKLNYARKMYIQEMIKERKEQKNLLENKLIRIKGLDREYQKKNLDANNQLLISSNKKKNRLEPIDKKRINLSNKNMIVYKNKNMKNNKIINIYEKNFDLDNDKNNMNDRYSYNQKREEEARRDILKKLNLKISDFNENKNENNYKNLSEFDSNNKNKKENKYTWDMLSNMKSQSLVDETELNNIIY
jgi:hypothetical protein